LRQVRGNASRDVVQLGEIDFRLLVQIDDRRLVRIAPAKCVQRFRYATKRNRKSVAAKRVGFRGINILSSPVTRSSP
jgi:hypothetical protein